MTKQLDLLNDYADGYRDGKDRAKRGLVSTPDDRYLSAPAREGLEHGLNDGFAALFGMPLSAVDGRE